MGGRDVHVRLHHPPQLGRLPVPRAEGLEIGPMDPHPTQLALRLSGDQEDAGMAERAATAATSAAAQAAQAAAQQLSAVPKRAGRARAGAAGLPGADGAAKRGPPAVAGPHPRGAPRVHPRAEEESPGGGARGVRAGLRVCHVPAVHAGRCGRADRRGHRGGDLALPGAGARALGWLRRHERGVGDALQRGVAALLLSAEAAEPPPKRRGAAQGDRAVSRRGSPDEQS
ncbi:MAG: hypothetical protein CL844_05580 [Crocinitomicaceae bacterium]|nr:hypothetical protein [Crocinitomicaceae bacterium]